MPFAVGKKLNEDMLYIYNHDPISWDMLDRWSQGEPPSYTLYTFFSLKTFFILFLALHVFQAVVIFILKRATSSNFKKAGLIRQMIHALENTSIPVPFRDWDVDTGTGQEHRQRVREVVTEVLSTLVVNKVIGIIMLVPLMYTGIE